MKKRLKKHLEKVINNFKWDVSGKDNYYQITIEAGPYINIERLKTAIKGVTEQDVTIDVSCIQTSLLDDDTFVGGYALLIEIYWLPG